MIALGPEPGGVERAAVRRDGCRAGSRAGRAGAGRTSHRHSPRPPPPARGIAGHRARRARGAGRPRRTRRRGAGRPGRGPLAHRRPRRCRRGRKRRASRTGARTSSRSSSRPRPWRPSGDPVEARRLALRALGAVGRSARSASSPGMPRSPIWPGRPSRRIPTAASHAGARAGAAGARRVRIGGCRGGIRGWSGRPGGRRTGTCSAPARRRDPPGPWVRRGRARGDRGATARTRLSRSSRATRSASSGRETEALEAFDLARGRLDADAPRRRRPEAARRVGDDAADATALTPRPPADAMRRRPIAWRRYAALPCVARAGRSRTAQPRDRAPRPAPSSPRPGAPGVARIERPDRPHGGTPAHPPPRQARRRPAPARRPRPHPVRGARPQDRRAQAGPRRPRARRGALRGPPREAVLPRASSSSSPRARSWRRPSRARTPSRSSAR